MIVQILITVSLAILLGAVVARRFELRLLKLMLIAICMAGIFFTWSPERLTDIANFVGVGRGADLVLYATAVLLFITIVALANQNREVNRQITRLTRNVAIELARKPGSEKTSG